MGTTFFFTQAKNIKMSENNNLQRENFAQDAQQTISMLQAMFSESNLTDSVVGVVVEENKGDLDKCVDTILDLLTDPVEVARKAQVEAAEEEIQLVREEQERRLKELEAHIKAQEEQLAKISDDSPSKSTNSNAKPKNNNNNNNNNSNNNNNNNKKHNQQQQQQQQQASTSAEELAQLTSVARRGAKKHGSAKANKKRLAAEQRLHKDFEERAAEEAAAIKAQREALENDFKKRLEKEIKAIRDKHTSPEFQARVEAEVAKRLLALDKRLNVAHAASKAERDAAKALASDAADLAQKKMCVVELELDAKHAMPGDTVTVTYRYKKGEPSSKDWIGFYKGTRAATSRDYYTQQYTDGQATGRIAFKIPSKLGICEFRFFQNNDYNVVTQSAPLHVGPRATLTARIEGSSTVVVRRVQLSGVPSSWDWVALYDHDQVDARQFAPGSTFAYIGTETDAATTLACPKTPGKYNVRWFSSGSGYPPLAVSNTIVVDDNDKVNVEPVNGPVARIGQPLRVACDISSIPAHKSHWVAVFDATDSDNHNYIDTYWYCPNWTATVDAPKEPGTYVVRAFQRGSYKVIKESAPFEVVE